MTVFIYRLFSEKCPNSCYVGSTERTLKYRLRKHKDKSYEAPNRRIYKKVFESGGWFDWEIEVLETIETDNRLTRLAREQFWMDEIKPDMNSIRCLG
jgi:hypothetical protein